MTVEVSESGVLFGTFDDANVLLIEQAVTEAKLDSNGVKSVEFVLLHRMRDEQPTISLVEAKTSIPRDSGSFFQNIREKILHSLAIWFRTVLGQHKCLERFLPKHQRSIDILKLPLRLVLVIPEAPDSMLAHLSDKFRQVLRADIKSWAIEYSAVVVMNRARAIKHRLVKSERHLIS